jgi:CubicO group peptidase (beta-lactamase class C family)
MHMPQFGGDTGIGWMQPTFLDKLFGNRTFIWHNGMVGGFSSYVSVDPAGRTGIVVLANKAVDITMLGMMLTRQARTQSWSPRAP